jgi:hypothetical protein
MPKMTDAEKRVRYEMARVNYRQWWRALVQRTSGLYANEIPAHTAAHRKQWRRVYKAGYACGLRAEQMRRELLREQL